MENSRELKEIGESFSALKRYTVLSGQEDVEDAVIEQGECLYTLKDARAFSSIYDAKVDCTGAGMKTKTFWRQRRLS